MMTPQEIFDTVVRKLAEQGGRSAIGGICAYRGCGGRKCAVGHLIPDDGYDPDMEGSGLTAVINDFGFQLPDYIHNNKRLLVRLQLFHDYSFTQVSRSEERKHLYECCKDYSLRPDVIDKYFPEEVV